MAKKNTAPVVKVTHTEMICWSIRYNELKREDCSTKLERAKAAQLSEIEGWCREELARIDTILSILHQLYKVETGTEYCG